MLTREVVCEIDMGAGAPRLPVLAITLGNPDPSVPAAGFFGGVHGLERIGAEVVIAHLASLVMRLRWDSSLHRQLEALRLVFMPIVNPGGMAQSTRANPNGVDLMRNAPVDAEHPVPFLIGGQRQSSRLPWYRGAAGAPMEAESEAVCRIVERELLARPFSMVVDCHSGFGTRDRVWFPYAHTARPIPHLADLHAFQRILDDAHPHHRYIVEPQSRQYLAHGDLWDHLYLRALAQRPESTFLPLTLEMGSWLWVKKNPRQLFSRHGIFNPLIEHRRERVLRRHTVWLDFVMRATQSHARWRPQGAQREAAHEAALSRWYRRPSA
ncbi:MAG TPA: M14 family zinc carboxypeptidase [Burkholderiaceae bacterium]|nr:M14 family zinc carboxypeptidase [Burkholderiaceae bacterium]